MLVGSSTSSLRLVASAPDCPISTILWISVEHSAAARTMTSVVQSDVLLAPMNMVPGAGALGI
jgi:hypothetical protein